MSRFSSQLPTIIYMARTFFISISIYYTYLKILNLKSSVNKKTLTIVIAFTVIISTVCSFIKFNSNSFIAILTLNILLGTLYSSITKTKAIYSMLITIVSLSINYILFFIATCISYPIASLVINNDYISLLFIVIIHTILLFSFFRIKKFKNGFTFFIRNNKNDFLDILVLNISIIVIFLAIIFNNFDQVFLSKIFFMFIIFSIIMFITIQKSLQLYYKQKLLIQDLEETKKELEDKKLEVERLEQENLSFSKVSHSIAHKQKSLEHKLNELMLKNEIASEIDIKDRLEAITKELKPKATVELSKTDIVEIDDMLKYMQTECINNKIEFELQISGNIHQMVNNHIEKEDLEILLADHIKNAIIAINYSDNINKSILVRLGIIDGCYSLYIYDSGIEFEIDTLEKLGKVPSTTHKESGGTGMGFMNTFDTLKKYKASMIISELGQPSKDNYTKVLMIKFDKKNEFKIKSYRSEEIENKCNSEDINVEKLIINNN